MRGDRPRNMPFPLWMVVVDGRFLFRKDDQTVTSAELEHRYVESMLFITLFLFLLVLCFILLMLVDLGAAEGIGLFETRMEDRFDAHLMFTGCLNFGCFASGLVRKRNICAV